MKKVFTILAAVLAIVGIDATALTFTAKVPADTKACYIAGDFTGWNHVQMTKVDDVTFTIDFPEATETQWYKYCSGPGWEYEETTGAGEPGANRHYSSEDIIPNWRSIYDPDYITIKVCIKYDYQPTIWWWGAGDKCPDAANTPNTYTGEGNYTWPGPSMQPMTDLDGWYYYEIKNVYCYSGVTIMIDGKNISENGVNVKTNTAFTVDGSYNPTQWPADPTYSKVKVCIQYDSAPTIWWWGAGSKCPNAEDTADPESEGAKYQYPGPTMLPLDGFEGWYYWEFDEVCDNSGVTMLIDGKNIMTDGVNVKADKAFDATGAEVEWPTVDPTSISLIKGSQKGIETYKILEDGKIYIIRDGVKYDIAGRIIK